MWYKPYGQTGKQVSVISFGGMRFTNPTDIESSAQLLLHAHKCGINYFDTAPYYCQDKSEDIFGAAIRAMLPGTFYVSTKSSDSSGNKLRASLEKSLKRLGVPKIHFFHIWCVNTTAVWRERVAGGALAAAIKAKEEGLIEHVVISTHLPGNEVEPILREAPIEGVTLGYCAINFPYRQAAVQSAGQLGRGVVTMNPLAGGLIPKHADKFAFLKGPADPSVTAAALRFNVSNPHVTSALVGFSTNEQIDEAVAAVADFQPYSPERIDAIRQKVLTTYNSLCTGCGYCLPCPMNINVPQFMDAYNMKMLQDGKPQDAINRLKWHWGVDNAAAKTCSLCGQCETKCTQHLPIRDRMKEIADTQDK
jgi:hypothetical protein